MVPVRDGEAIRLRQAALPGQSVHDFSAASCSTVYRTAATTEKLSCAPSWSVPRLPERVGVFLTRRVRDE